MKTLSAGLLFWLVTAAAIVSPAQTFTNLASFGINDGQYAAGPFVQGADGNFYGPMEQGGTTNLGTILK